MKGVIILNYSLSVLNKLKDIKEDKDIKTLSSAIFSGTHCPLFGVALTASYVKDMAMLVIGTSECTYYTKVILRFLVIIDKKEWIRFILL